MLNHEARWFVTLWLLDVIRSFVLKFLRFLFVCFMTALAFPWLGFYKPEWLLVWNVTVFTFWNTDMETNLAENKCDWCHIVLWSLLRRNINAEENVSLNCVSCAMLMTVTVWRFGLGIPCCYCFTWWMQEWFQAIYSKAETTFPIGQLPTLFK